MSLIQLASNYISKVWKSPNAHDKSLKSNWPFFQGLKVVFFFPLWFCLGANPSTKVKRIVLVYIVVHTSQVQVLFECSGDNDGEGCDMQCTNLKEKNKTLKKREKGKGKRKGKEKEDI